MSTPVTNKLLIINSILLVMILTQLLLLNYNVLIKKFTYNPAELYSPDNEDETGEKYYHKQDSLKADFEELKNDTIPLPDEIIKIITAELEGFNWNDEFQEEDLPEMYHETIFAQQFPSNNAPSRKLIILTFSNNVGNFSHASSGRVSLFEFKRDNKSWQMTRNYLAFGNGNEYGYEPLGCELVRIGYNNKYAVIVHTSYSGQGHEKESKAVYSEVDESFELVFDFTSYEYYNDYPEDIEYTDGYSNMRILKSNKSWFDIETKSDFNEWNDKTPGAVKRFIFNGEEYVEANRNFNTSPTNRLRQ
jgi:hypothetical protein